ncbi:TetR/AcrR family transcriptional regulator [Paenibacillus urinalis]|uniref:TetR/AcrR family transcriptional regulator n=1 Tax=Paenibacillus urinalis TaxID=521520 RepID=UPI001960416A
MSKINILKTAVVCFANHAYEGSTISMIATESNLKKSTVYSHFPCKEEIYRQALRLAIESLEQGIYLYFQENKREGITTLKGFLHWIQETYTNNPKLAFLLRSKLFPPVEFTEENHRLFSSLMFRFNQKLVHYLKINFRCKEEINIRRHNEIVATAYISVVEGLLMDLLLNRREKSNIKLNAIWPVFLKGIEINSTK